MIKHIVMWKLKDDAEGNSKAENAKIIKDSLEDLQGKIKEIVALEVGIDVNKSEQAYDIVLYSTFNSLEDLDSYQKNPDHVKAGSFVKKVASSRVVVDYEV
ncbi:Dabb family protein [Clostridium sp. LIBA-8841]|uniref:Dabb family protein n=1 Tax=Clostridium sp. LIBA-8841 TaxID=2987530 RepID=UPI002AC7AA91|nr:Dabb family protein [Clostridium sp. LIBA-8841]MDZ5253913.1 Dabb family protein [Clostridium sp. LIBA-8841]